MISGNDELISVDEVALRWRTAVNAVAALVADRTIPSLDGGQLARRGRFSIPVLRMSWAEDVRVASPGAPRRLDTHIPEGHLHPAASAAIDLHHALSRRDAGAVWRLSTPKSGAVAGDPQRLVQMWLATLGDVFHERTSIATGVYALVPHRGVGVRIVPRVGPLPIRYDHPTPQDTIGMIVFVSEDGRWYADLPLTGAEVNYLELTRSAPPEDWSPADGAVP